MGLCAHKRVAARVLMAWLGFLGGGCVDEALAELSCERGHGRGCASAAAIQHRSGQHAAEMAWLERGCGLSDGASCSGLGYNLQAGHGGLEKDTAAARKHYRRACDLGSDTGCHNLGEVLLLGVGGPTEPHEGYAHLQRTCDLGIPDSCSMLGVYYLRGDRRAGEPEDGLARLERGCERGETVACRMGAIAQALGLGGEASSDRALELARRGCASEQDCPFADHIARVLYNPDQQAHTRCSLGYAEACREQALPETGGATADN